MSLRIEKGNTKFLRGIDSVSNLHEFFGKHDEPIGLAFLGRSNVGKSTLINSLFGKSVARTSKTPGRTREINVFNFGLNKVDKNSIPPLYLFDLPGYGFAAVSKQQKKLWNQMITEFFAVLPPTILMVCIQDARHPDQKADQDFQDFLQGFNFEVALVYNKFDKLKTQKDRSKLQKETNAYAKENPWVNEIFTVSAEKGTGLKELQKCIGEFLKNQLN